jgi:hypothetical protein
LLRQGEIDRIGERAEGVLGFPKPGRFPPASVVLLEGAEVGAFESLDPGMSCGTLQIIVKPCAGKLHARFERVLLKTGWPV